MKLNLKFKNNLFNIIKQTKISLNLLDEILYIDIVIEIKKFFFKLKT